MRQLVAGIIINHRSPSVKGICIFSYVILIFLSYKHNYMIGMHHKCSWVLQNQLS